MDFVIEKKIFAERSIIMLSLAADAATKFSYNFLHHFKHNHRPHRLRGVDQKKMIAKVVLRTMEDRSSFHQGAISLEIAKPFGSTQRFGQFPHKRKEFKICFTLLWMAFIVDGGHDQS